MILNYGKSIKMVHLIEINCFFLLFQLNNDISIEITSLYFIILQFMIKNLTEKELGHSFFFSIKLGDYEHALYLLQLGVSINTSYFVAQDQLIYTINLVVARTAEVIKKYGTSHAKAQLVIKILDICLQQKPDLRCHCTNKNPHYCALSQAFKFIRFQSEEDLFLEDNLLILKLLFNGASYKNLSNSKQYKWAGLNVLSSYITTKKSEVVSLLKTNRHSKCCNKNANRHSKCALNLNICPSQL